MNQRAASPTIVDVRTFWDDRPCNIRHSPAPMGTRQYFDEVEARKYFIEYHIPAFADFKRWRGKKVLEIGAGIGTDSVNFARAGADLTVVELSPVTLDLCRKRFEVFGLKAKFYAADVEHLSDVVPAEKYDLVYSFGVLHHTPDARTAIQEIKKYMGPDSEFRVMLYARYSWKNFLISVGLAQPEAQFGCPIANVYSRKEIEQLLTGLRITSIQKDHVFPYLVEPYKRYEYVKAFPWNITPRPLMRWLEHRLGWHTLVVAKL